MIYPEDTEFLEHFGVKGMHWGIRNDPKPHRSEHLVAKNSASKETKRAVNDHNHLPSGEFGKKYAVSRVTYKKRFKKYGGDPFMNSPLAKAGKKLETTGFAKNAKKNVDTHNRRSAQGGFTISKKSAKIAAGAAIAAGILGHVGNTVSQSIAPGSKSSFSSNVGLGALSVVGLLAAKGSDVFLPNHRYKG